MPGRNTKRIAAYGLLAGMAALQVACGKRSLPDNSTQPPILNYQTPTVLATANQPFTSVAPDVTAYVVNNGIGSMMTAGFNFAVSPALPPGLTLDPSTGVIHGTPTGPVPDEPCTITAYDVGGPGSFALSLGVQDSTPVSMAYAGTAAVSTAVGAAMVLAPPVVTGDVATGFGVWPYLPPGLVLSPTSGLISGTATAALPPTVFTLTATTPTGSANATFHLLVAATAPSAPFGLDYGTGNSVTASAGAALSVTPTLNVLVSGKPVAVPVPADLDLFFTVSPALPGGLNLDLQTGILSGTPTAPTAQATYTITASNAGGNSVASVVLTVN